MPRWMMLPALVGLSWAIAAGAAEYAASDYLPLAVGNSWTYGHEYYDLNAMEEEEDWGDDWPDFWGNHQFTIAVERTEELDGRTYYVISDMPALWPPAPPHFIAGKKLRWEGTHLMEYRAGGEQALYRFDGADETGYTVSTDKGQDRVTVKAGPNPVPWYAFSFHSNAYGEGAQACNFLAGYGLRSCAQNISGDDHPLFENQIRAKRAALAGIVVESEDALIPTSTSSSTWGEVKQSLYSQRTEEGTDR